MIIHRIHYRNLNTYLACYYHHLRRVPFHGSKIFPVSKIKKIELTKSKGKLLSAMA
jgi:anaerobic ribonucleoside-triphosphate reductase